MSRKESKDKHFLKQPIYKGGKAAMDALIKQAMNYPKEALKNKTEGSVYLKYEIDYKGKVKTVKVLSSLGDGCDEEAVRLIKLFQFEVPPVPRKMRVLFNKKIRIHFRLPKAAPKKKGVQINYNVSISGKQKQQSAPKKASYAYTIQIN